MVFSVDVVMFTSTDLSLQGKGDTTSSPSAVIAARTQPRDLRPCQRTWESTMDAVAYALLLLGALAGGFVSGLAGFGTALMALGIWLYVLPPSIAVPLVLICSVVAQSSTLPSMWKSFDLTLVWPFIVGGLAGVPVGTMLVAHADPRVFKLTIGVFLLLFPTVLFLNRRPMAVRFGGRLADGAIGFAGGIL